MRCAPTTRPTRPPATKSTNQLNTITTQHTTAQHSTTQQHRKTSSEKVLEHLSPIPRNPVQYTSQRLVQIQSVHLSTSHATVTRRVHLGASPTYYTLWKKRATSSAAAAATTDLRVTSASFEGQTAYDECPLIQRRRPLWTQRASKWLKWGGCDEAQVKKQVL